MKLSTENGSREKGNWKSNMQISFFIQKSFSEGINILKYFIQVINIKSS